MIILTQEYIQDEMMVKTIILPTSISENTGKLHV